jgi:hypothetical protein
VRVCSAGLISATCSAARSPRRAPFLGWTLIGWIIALVLILILVAIVLLDKRRDFRDVRSFDFTFSHQMRL